MVAVRRTGSRELSLTSKELRTTDRNSCLEQKSSYHVTSRNLQRRLRIPRTLMTEF